MAEKAHKLGVELVEYITKDEALQPESCSPMSRKAPTMWTL